VQLAALLFGSAFTLAVCVSLGGLLLGESCRDRGARLVAGGAILSLAVFALSACHLAYPLVFLVAGAAAIAAAYWRRGAGKVDTAAEHVRPWYRSPWCWLWFVAFGFFSVLYLANAMAPEVSPDGSAYHLGIVGRYFRAHGLVAINDNMYAAMPEGVEMLFLFAYSFGRHSAAAMVHFGFFVALVWQVYAYGRRRGFPIAAAAAALIVYASPVAGIDGISAYNDVAVAAVAFTMFHLIEIWDEAQSPRLLAAIGLLAGFAFAIKYTAWPAIPLALILVAFKRRRDAIPVAALAAFAVAPWLIRNWIVFHNPAAPFYNRVFPNPSIMPGFEDMYRRMMAIYHLKSLWQIPMDVTAHGTLSGLLGPVFLLAPIGLLALRRREGRRLWLCAAFLALNYFSNIATRFLIPSMPFVALAMMLALNAVPRAAAAIAMVSALISWPPFVPRYADQNAWRLIKIPWKEALRIRGEESYLTRRMGDYPISRLIDRVTEPSATIFTFTCPPEAYTSRHMRVEYHSAANQIAGKLLWTAVEPEFVPTWRLRFAFPPRPLRALRVVQTRSGPDTWYIHEFRIYDGVRELRRAPQWRLTASSYPWGVQDAFDNSLATFWMAGEPQVPGQSVSVDFGGVERADSVVLETAPNQWKSAYRLEGQSPDGRWAELSPAPAMSEAPRPLGLRRAVASELKRRGIDYLLIFDRDVGADDLRLNADLWGIAVAGELPGVRLYRLP
jgi:hypothetical protein